MAGMLDKGSNGRTVDVRVGEDVVLALEETPTTGYRWHLRLDPGLTEVASTYVPYEGGAIGAGGVRRLVVRAIRPGEHLLEAKLWREWIGESSTIDVVTIRIRAT